MKSKKPNSYCRTILLLGSGELGRELTIALKRLGQKVIAVDRYAHAPAMQVADGSEVISMLDGTALEKVVRKYQPDLIVPEIEAIRTEKLIELESEGFQVIPNARAAFLTMNRSAIRDLAAKKLKVKTARYAYAETYPELLAHAEAIGFPNVVKPIMSSSGKGQSVVKKPTDLKKAWEYALANKRGDQTQVIIEEFIEFNLEITLLTIREQGGATHFAPAIGHRQERGDYQESWCPCGLTKKQLIAAQKMAKKVTQELGGVGLFGVEFFIGKNGEVYFSELSPRPHDTGLVSLVSFNQSEFELHARAILGLPIPKVKLVQKASASAVVLAEKSLSHPNYSGVPEALKDQNIEVRIFGKPEAHRYRRMGVCLSFANSVQEARKRASRAAQKIKVIEGRS